MTKTPLAMILSGIVVVLLASNPSPAQKNSPPKPQRVQWEYRVLSEDEIDKLGGYDREKTAYDKKFFEAGLNKLGEEGWELVQAGRGTSLTYFFKRQKQN
jgi:hypothetical protein